MFFTLIIPAYNCEKTINRLLDSIIEQYEQDLKIFIIDDSDHEGLYENFIKNYKQKLNIEYYHRRNDLYSIHCPSNTRHDGLRRALEENTKYIFFIDCDDELIPNSLSMVKEIIIKNNYPSKIFSPFYKYDNETGEQKELQFGPYWLHGNFYKKSFLKKYNIQFKIDLSTHEDVYFNALTSSFLLAENEQIFYMDLLIYKWYYRKDSASHIYFLKKNIKYNFIEIHLLNFLEATINPYILAKQKYPELSQICYEHIVFDLMSGYFFIQGSYYLKNYKQYKINYKIYKSKLIEIINEFNVTTNDIIKTAYNHNVEFNFLREECKTYICNYIETESFKDFINSFNL